MNLGEIVQLKVKREVVVLLCATALLFGLRLAIPERGYDDTGWRAWWDSAFAFGLVALILLIAVSAGMKVLRGLKIQGIDKMGRLVTACGIGLGITAYGVLFLGLIGWLHPWSIFGWLGILAWTCRTELQKILEKSPRAWGVFRAKYKEREYAQKGLILLTVCILGLNVIQALTPPWGYDALMYHLQAPRIFLEQGRITLLPDIWQANGPLTIEMLYTLGLAAGSDVFAKLLHLAFLGLLFGGTFSLGRRLLGATGGWLSLGVIAGIPILPIWGNLAYSDMALALFCLLTFLALAWWREENDVRYLRLAGLSTGFALGSKYTAMGMAVAFGSWILLLSHRGGWKEAFRKAAIFAVPATLVASPWFVKNLVMAGNPVFPFYFGGPGWDGSRLDAINSYLVDAFGTGRSFWDYLLLPFNLYAQHGEFGTSFSTIEFPSFLFPLVILYPLARRLINLDEYFWLLAALFGLWAAGSQQTRFLIPLYPLFCVISSLSLLWLGKQISQPMYKRIIAVGLVGGFVVVSLFYQISHQVGVNPYPVILGSESKSGFLERAVYDYRTIGFIKDNLKDDERVLLMWDGQGYYCDERCIPDADQTRLWRLYQLALKPIELAELLIGEGNSHILIDIEGLSFFIHNDVDGRHARASEYFFDQFVPQCGKEIFRDEKVTLYKIGCPDEGRSND